MSFQASSTYARSSILEFGGILRSGQRGYVNSGEESNDLRPQVQDAPGRQNHQERTSPTIQNVVKGAQLDEEYESHAQAIPNAPPAIMSPHTRDMRMRDNCSTSTTSKHRQEESQQHGQVSEPSFEALQSNKTFMTSEQPQTEAFESSVLDVFNPFSDPEMLSVFPSIEMLGFDSFDTNFMDLDYLNSDNA